MLRSTMIIARAVCGAELLGEEIDQHATDSQLSQLRLEKIGEPPANGPVYCLFVSSQDLFSRLLIY